VANDTLISNDPKFVNDETAYKYLAVWNWGNFQKHMKKTKGARRPYVMDACSKDTDPDYSRLTYVQRYVLDACRRLVGLHGKNLSNNSRVIANQLASLSQDKRNLIRTVSELVDCRLLILTNESDPFSPKTNRTEGNIKEVEGNEDVVEEPMENEEQPNEKCTHERVVRGVCLNCGETAPGEAITTVSKAFEIEED